MHLQLINIQQKNLKLDQNWHLQCWQPQRVRVYREQLLGELNNPLCLKFSYRSSGLASIDYFTVVLPSSPQSGVTNGSDIRTCIILPTLQE